MPRKSKSPRKPLSPSPRAKARDPRPGFSPRQARLPQGLDRHHRGSKRPPVFPGRQGGR